MALDLGGGVWAWVPQLFGRNFCSSGNQINGINGSNSTAQVVLVNLGIFSKLGIWHAFGCYCLIYMRIRGRKSLEERQSLETKGEALRMTS